MARAALVSMLVVAAIAAAAAAAVPSTASLELASARPFAVRGEGFKPREVVLLLVTRERETRSRRVTTSTTGVLRARFRFALGRCQPFSVRAFGSRGSRAILHSGFQLACEPDR